jgi:hypothetical protein
MANGQIAPILAVRETAAGPRGFDLKQPWLRAPDELLGGSSGRKLSNRMASRATDKTTERCPTGPLGSVLRDRENQ